MPLIPLELPPGVYRNGTDLQSQGRYRDSNLVRWHDGTMRPIGGWRKRSDTAGGFKLRGMLAWADNSAERWIGTGSKDKLYAYAPSGTQYDITPTGLTVGDEDAQSATGYGDGYYGDQYYGTERVDVDTVIPATSWALDTWGEYMIACSNSDGKIYEWQLDSLTPAAQITNAPTNNTSMVVTEERFLMALGAGGNPRKVAWCDREDNTLWIPAATNEAGDFDLQTNGRIRCGIRVQNQTLILTSADAHAAIYSGPPYVYGFERVGNGCGIIGPQAVCAVDTGAFWMGTRAFYIYSGGSVRELDCDVADYVFSELNRGQVSKVECAANSRYGEIWWFYPSDDSMENNRYVVYNFNENTWYIGEMDVTAAVDSGVFRNPIRAHAADNHIYDHETGTEYGGVLPRAETGPILLGSGDNTMSVTGMIPDEKTQGGVDVTFKTRFYPNDTERTYGPYDMSNPTSLRFTGRQVRMLIQASGQDDWRVGINRLEIKQSSRR